MQDTYGQQKEYNSAPSPPEDVLRVLELFKPIIEYSSAKLFIPVFGVAVGLEGESIRNYRFEATEREEGTRFNYLYGKLENIINEEF